MTLQANTQVDTHADQVQGIDCLWSRTYAEVMHKHEEHQYTLPCKQNECNTYAFCVTLKLST